jgi:hypothetical protein
LSYDTLAIYKIDIPHENFDSISNLIQSLKIDKESKYDIGYSCRFNKNDKYILINRNDILNIFTLFKEIDCKYKLTPNIVNQLKNSAHKNLDLNEHKEAFLLSEIIQNRCNISYNVGSDDNSYIKTSHYRYIANTDTNVLNKKEALKQLIDIPKPVVICSSN